MHDDLVYILKNEDIHINHKLEMEKEGEMKIKKTKGKVQKTK